MTHKWNWFRLVRASGASWLALATLLSWNPATDAQDNSLLHAQRRPNGSGTPTSQPAIGATAGGRLKPIQPGVKDAPEEPPPNPVLLAVSPFAVAPPKVKRFQVNDLVTVIIRESRTSLNDAKSNLDKTWQLQAELSKWFRLDDKHNLVAQDLTLAGTPGVDWNFQNTYDTKGKYDRKDELTTRITAVVIDVKPNGNLTLEARKEVTHSGNDKLIATLTGMCRALDVTPQNTVLSTQIADLKIDMVDTGAVRDATRRGWLMHLFDFARPI